MDNPANQSLLNKMDLPNSGFVRYVDHMGSDLTVVNAARVSMGKEHHEFDDKADTQLIRYLVKHKHVSPFYHPQLTIHVKCPIFVERQWFKHRIGTAANSISGRYVQFEPTFWTPTRPLSRRWPMLHGSILRR